MNDLINIKNANGKQTVSAKEMYLGLGLSKDQWSRWSKTNIQENDFFIHGVDWVRHDVEGSETIDFEITVEFAKHIAMMAKTKKSHKYRNYFLICEEQAKTRQSQLSKEFQALFILDKRTIEIDNRLVKLENNMTIDYEQQEILNGKARFVVVQALGGKDAPAYKECNRKAFSELWRHYKRVMQVNSYKNTATVNYDKGREIIENWKPNRDLELMILGANSQFKMKL